MLDAKAERRQLKDRARQGETTLAQDVSPGYGVYIDSGAGFSRRHTSLRSHKQRCSSSDLAGFLEDTIAEGLLISSVTLCLCGE